MLELILAIINLNLAQKPILGRAISQNGLGTGNILILHLFSDFRRFEAKKKNEAVQ